MGALSREEIEEKLAAAAKGGYFLFYEDLLTKDTTDSRRALYCLLGKINDENQDGLNITALVIDRRTGMPGPGFFRGLVAGKTKADIPPEKVYTVFCGEIRRIFRHYNAPEKFGALIDADNCGNFAQVEEFLQRDIPNKRDAVICWVCGKDNQRDMSPLKRHNPEFLSIRENLRDSKNAADFVLSMQGAVMLSTPNIHGVIDVLLVYSGDYDLGHLEIFAKRNQSKFRQFNNRGEEFSPIGKGKRQ